MIGQYQQISNEYLAMKTTLILLAASVAFLYAPGGTNSAADEMVTTNLLNKGDVVTIECPTDLRAGGQRGRTTYTLGFVLRPIQDFRLMYCNSKTLQRRIASGVCVVDSDTSSGTCQDIKVSSDSTLGEVLRKFGYGFEKWQPGFQPEIRIITRFAILSDNGEAQFLQTKLSPGDFVVILRTYN